MSAEIEIQWFTDKVEQEVNKAGMRGLKKWAEATVGVMKNAAPNKTGTLMRSITVSEGGIPDPELVYQKAINKQETELNNPIGNENSVYITANTPYALRQHETNKTKSKYLERPFLQYKDKAQGYVDRELKK